MPLARARIARALRVLCNEVMFSVIYSTKGKLMAAVIFFGTKNDQ